MTAAASFEEINALENQYWGLRGRPTLGRAYGLLRERWQEGARDRETGLRLLFLSWYSQAEPQGLTGLTLATLDLDELRKYLDAAWDGDQDDPEVFLVVRVMTAVTPWLFEHDSYWVSLGETLTERLGERRYHMDPKIFEGRGAYGSYFANQCRIHPDDAAERERTQALNRDRRRDH